MTFKNEAPQADQLSTIAEAPRIRIGAQPAATRVSIDSALVSYANPPAPVFGTRTSASNSSGWSAVCKKSTNSSPVLRPGSPSEVPALISEFELVESCYSVAGDNSYALVVRAPSTKDLEELLDALRAKLEVTTRATVVLSTPFEHRPLLHATT